MLERELYSALENTADAAFVVDEQGITRSWNRAAEKLFGLRASEVVNQPCAGLLQGKSPLGTPVCMEHCSIIECAVKHREISNYDLEVNGQRAESLWVNISILVFREDRSGRTLVVHLARDISERKKKEVLTEKFVQLAREIAAQSDDINLAPASPLTEQERRILRALAQGQDPAHLAKELGISPRTLRNHLHHVNQKLRTKNRLEAVMQATRRGLI
jgi:PAS domain S-box-containing protein